MINDYERNLEEIWRESKCQNKRLDNVCSQTRRSNPFVLVGRRGGRDGCHLDRRRMRGESCIHFGRPRGSSETAPVQAWSESWTLLHERRPCYRSPRQHYGLSYISSDRAAGGNSFLPRLWPDPRYVAEFHGRPNSAGAPQFPGGATVQLPRSTANCITSDVKVVVNNIFVLTSINRPFYNANHLIFILNYSFRMILRLFLLFFFFPFSFS